MLTREEIDQIQMAFEMLDEDLTGHITFANLKRVARDLGEALRDQELHEIINEADTDNDSKISFDEFVALVRSAKLSSTIGIVALLSKKQVRGEPFVLCRHDATLQNRRKIETELLQTGNGSLYFGAERR
jgi:hypothetical protein